MAKYRKIDPRIWNDAKFCQLSDTGKLAFLFVLTHPHMTALGAMRHTVNGMAGELGNGKRTKAYREAFAEALAVGLLEADETACFVGAPNFLKYNRPESPNVVKAWAGALDLIPECGLKSLLLQRVKAFAEGLPDGFTEALPKDFAKSMPIQEQEQEPEQKQEGNSIVAPVPGATSANGLLRRQVQAVYEIHCAARVKFYEKVNGQPPGVLPDLSAPVKKVIRNSIQQHGFSKSWQAGIGVFYSDWHTGRDPETKGKRYLGLPLVWSINPNRDNVETFAELYHEIPLGDSMQAVVKDVMEAHDVSA